MNSVLKQRSRLQFGAIMISAALYVEYMKSGTST